MKKEKRKFLNAMGSAWRDLKPIILSHHPSCPVFHDHTLNIKKLRLCIGCFIGYPAGLLSFLLFHFLLKSLIIHSLIILILGISLFITILLSLTNLTEVKIIKIGQKLSVGLGAGMIISYFFILFAPILWWEQLIVFFSIVSILMTPVGLLHYRTMVNTCKKCEFQRNPEYCDIKYCMAPRFSQSN